MIRPLLLLALLCCAGARAGAVVELRACVGTDAEPPFTYTYRQDGRELTGGFAWRLLDEILPAEQWRLRIAVLPWTRCLHEISAGQQDLSVNVTWNEERARLYRLSRAYFHTHVHFFYSRERMPEAPVRALADLQHLKVCGVLGHNYALVGLQPAQVDSGSKDYGSVFRKLLAGRCEVFANSLEDLQGQESMGARWLADPRIAHAPVPGVAPVGRHFVFSRTSAHAAALADEVDAGIERLQASGRLAALFEEEAALVQRRFPQPGEPPRQ